MEFHDEEFDINYLLQSVDENNFEIVNQNQSENQQSFAYDSVLGRVSKLKLFTVFFQVILKSLVINPINYFRI